MFLIFSRKKLEEKERNTSGHLIWPRYMVNGQVCVHTRTYFAWIGTYGGVMRKEWKGRLGRMRIGAYHDGGVNGASRYLPFNGN